MNRALLIFTVAVAWHLLTWDAEQGLNLLLMTLVTMGAAIGLKPDIVARGEVRWLLAAWLLTGIFVVWHHSDLSIFTYWLVCFVCVGYLQPERVRFWIFGCLESVAGIFSGWFFGILHAVEGMPGTRMVRHFLRRAGAWLVPLVVVMVFYSIYSDANTVLGTFNSWLNKQLQPFFAWEWDGTRLGVFVLCWVGVLALLGTRPGLVRLHRWADAWTYTLSRRRRQSALQSQLMGLKYEYQIARITFIALNVLLLVINCLDVAYVWLDTTSKSAAELSQYVHEGTWLLIFSIVLAMLVVLLFFRDKLNFFPHVQPLRYGAYLWLGQNAFLAISVGVRNGRYIQDYGLAHGRIVVLFFLMLVGYGLYTMYMKVRRPYSFYYLLQTNARAVLIACVLMAAVNWDSLITRYNIRMSAPDTYYLTGQLDNNLVPLLQHLKTAHPPAFSAADIQHRLENHRKNWEASDWRSWNWSDYRQAQMVYEWLYE